MNRSAVVALFGKLSTRCAALAPLAGEFGFSIKQVPDIDSLRRLGSDCRVIAVLVETAGLEISGTEALQSIQNAAPSAKLIACRRFSDNILWTQLAGAGAFHDLHMPFDLLELRQAMGFVWAAQQRVAKVRALIPFPIPRRRAS
jgi:DNA-binding NtrC family response regulator